MKVRQWGAVALAGLVIAACAGLRPEQADEQAEVASSTAVPGSGGAAGPGAGEGPVLAVALPALAPGDSSHRVTDENARPGTTDWRITTDNPKSVIEGFADTSSAALGDEVNLMVATGEDGWQARAYRMGWYGGAQGRLVWSSGPQPLQYQPKAVVDARSGMAEAPWSTSLSIPITATWVPGTYLVKLTAPKGGAHYIPLTIRDDASTAALLAINAVTTWQAYNDWGSCSLYRCLFAKHRRGEVVSFDRPYFHPYGKGSADFLDHELPLISLAEQLGFDITYATDLDLQREPSLTHRHRAVLSLGHDEYYSTAMREALQSARDAGVNLAFFGANAIYRRITLESGRNARPLRREVNHRAGDTAEWRSGGQPESALIGIGYDCAGMTGDMRLVNTANWVYEGSGARDGQVLKGLVANEFDNVQRLPSTPKNLELLSHSPVVCGGDHSHANSSYYTAPGGAGVFATGTIHWICNLDTTCGPSPYTSAVVRRVTANVLIAFARGPAGETHPSVGNVGRVTGSR